MRGLMLKDLYAWGNYFKQVGIFMVILIVFGIVMKSPTYCSFMFVFLGISINMSGFSTDEYYHWDTYACSLPVSKKEIVASKYLVILIMTVIFGIISSAVAWGSSVILKQAAAQNILTSLVTVMVVPILCGIVMPVIYKYGIEKGRMAYIGIVMIPAIVLLLGERLLKESGIHISEFEKWFAKLGNQEVVVPIIMILLVAVIYGISYLISIRIYEKKEF